MSVQAVLTRISQIEDGLSPSRPSAPPPTSAPSSFSSVLGAQTPGASPMALATPAAGAAGTLGVGPVGAAGSGGDRAGALVCAAEGEVGQAEQPPGSNDSARIAAYRSATAGAGVGPWCAYFASWCAKQAGAPLGEQGQGFGSVSALYAWAQRTGRAVPAGAGVRPTPGELIVWGARHIGVVESVDANGTIHTIEGNSSDRVSRRTYGPDGGGATGYVRVG